MAALFTADTYSLDRFAYCARSRSCLELQGLMHLKADCLKNPVRGSVEIEHLKRRARGAEHKRRLRVRDGGVNTPGGLIRLALSLTAIRAAITSQHSMCKSRRFDAASARKCARSELGLT